MGVHSIHHFNLRATAGELRVLRDFYCNIVGLHEGPRPPFRSAGFWLYADGVPLLHLSEMRATESLPPVPQRVSAVDHLAFNCSDLAATVALLREHHVEHSVDTVPATGRVQIFLTDPAGVGVELNFANGSS